MRKYNDKKNLAGEYIKEKRLQLKLNRADLARELQLIRLKCNSRFHL